MKHDKHEYLVIAYLRDFKMMNLNFDIFYADNDVQLRTVTRVIVSNKIRYEDYHVFKSL